MLTADAKKLKKQKPTKEKEVKKPVRKKEK
jgi:hypothetical protein